MLTKAGNCCRLSGRNAVDPMAWLSVHWADQLPSYSCSHRRHVAGESAAVAQSPTNSGKQDLLADHGATPLPTLQQPAVAANQGTSASEWSSISRAVSGTGAAAGLLKGTGCDAF